MEPFEDHFKFNYVKKENVTKQTTTRQVLRWNWGPI
jgi:hypothetical protein